MNQQRLRRLAYERDQGICASCGIDCGKIKRVYWTILDFDAQSFYELVLGAGNKPQIFWEADHIIERADGGLDEIANIQTLCLKCHFAKSTANKTVRRQQQEVQRRAERQARIDVEAQNRRDTALATSVLYISKRREAVKRIGRPAYDVLVNDSDDEAPVVSPAALVAEFVNSYLQARHANNPGGVARAMEPIEMDHYGNFVRDHDVLY